MKDIIYALGSLATIALFFVGLFMWKEGTTEVIEATQIDTVVVTNTIVEDNPVYIHETLVRRDTIFVNHTDTLHTVDTVFVPITQKYYEEQDGRLRIWISGYLPELDRYELDELTQIITNTVKVRKRWGFSVTAGPSLIYSGIGKGVDFGVGITCGLSYTF